MTPERRKHDDEFSLGRLRDLFIGTPRRTAFWVAVVASVILIPPVQRLALKGLGIVIHNLGEMILPILALVAILVLARKSH